MAREEKRKKRFYLLSVSGALVLEQLLDEWSSLDSLSAKS